MPSDYLNQPDTVSGTANATVSQTYAANTLVTHLITQIHCGYNADPTSGSIVITSGGTTRYTMPVIKGGAAPIYFDPPFPGGFGEAVVVTLSPGGGSVVGYLNVWHVTK